MEKKLEIINKIINNVRKGIGVYYAFNNLPHIYGMVNFAVHKDGLTELRDNLLQELPTDMPGLNPNHHDILNVFEAAPEYDDNNEFVGVKSDKGTCQLMIPYCELTEQDMAEMILAEMPHLKNNYTHSGFIRCDSDEAERIRKRYGCDIIEVVHKAGSDKYKCARVPLDNGHIDAKEYYIDDGYTVYDTMQELISELEAMKKELIETGDDEGVEFINNKLMCAKCVGEIKEGNIIVCCEDYDFDVSPRYVDVYVDKNSYQYEVAIDLRCVW